MSEIWIASYAVLWILVVVLALMILLVYRQLGEMYLGTREGRARDGLGLGARAPRFTLTNQDGKSVSFPRGILSLVVFGSPSCGPCAKLMPELVNFRQEVGGRVDVAFVSSGDAEANRKFARENAVSFDVLTEPRMTLFDAYKVRATPFAFYLDENGLVRAKGIVNQLTQLRALVVRGGGIPEDNEISSPATAVPLEGVRE